MNYHEVNSCATATQVKKQNLPAPRMASVSINPCQTSHYLKRIHYPYFEYQHSFYLLLNVIIRIIMFCFCVFIFFLLSLIFVKFIMQHQRAAVVLSFSSLCNITDQEHSIILLSILLMMDLWVLSHLNCFHSCCYGHCYISAYISIKYIPKSRAHLCIGSAYVPLKLIMPNRFSKWLYQFTFQ